MGSKFFEELSRCLGKEQIESLSKEDRRLEIFLHGQPVLSVSPGNEVFMLPSGSKNPEANELYHRVAIAADRVFEYGRVGTETTRRAQSLREQTGLDPDISWSSTGRIQLNQEITVVLTYETNLGLFAGFGSFPITLRSEATGKSEVYWK